MNVVEFGRALLETEDLDPVYCALVRAELDEDTLHRWLLAYWCYYHAGVASALAQRRGPDYWDLFERAAHNEGRAWPREAERRHFRGEACLRATYELRRQYPKPEAFVELLASGKALTYDIVATRVKRHRLFGPWIAFKVADMLERVVGVPVEFPDDVLLYDSPRKGAADVASIDLGLALPPEQAEAAGRQHVVNEFKRWMAPPRRDRACGVQEVETILCKYHSHARGRYVVGHDLAGLRRALDPARWGKLADRLREAAP